MKVLKKIVNIITAFIITVLIMLNFSAIVIKATVLNEDYVLSKLEEVGYCEKIDGDLKNAFEGYQYQSGFPEEIFKDLYSYSDLKSDVVSVVDSIYKGTEINLSTETIYDNLTRNIDNYVIENGLIVEKDKIDDFKNEIVKAYEEKINFLVDYLDIENVSDIMIKINNVGKFVVAGLIVALLFCIIFDLIVNINCISEFFNTLCISLLASGVIMELFKFVIVKNIDISNLLVLNQSFSDFAKYIIFDILNNFNTFGIGFVIIGVIGIIWSNYKKRI